MRLDGIWEFAFTASPEELPEYYSFAPVPGCFDAEGLRFPQQGFGWYRRTFEASGKLRLKIGSSGLRTAVFLDGRKAAESPHAWEPTILDFETGSGEHELVIRTDNLITDHLLFRDNYDFYGFGGIYDHVDLERAPEIRSAKIRVLDWRTGEIEVAVDSDAAQFSVSFDHGKTETLPARKTLRLTVPDPLPWTPETPHLHTLKINDLSVEFGLRTIRTEGRRLLLNDQELKLIGVNRHESHPEFGAATPEALIASDLLRIKQAGCNFIRGCHYPQREYLLSLCDRLGLLVWEEALSWGNSAKDLSNPVFMDTLAEHTVKMIETSFNHPSLIIHGFLNECESHTEEARFLIRHLAGLARKLDPDRPVSFASNRPLKDVCFDLIDICSINVYPAWYSEGGTDTVEQELNHYAEHLPEKPLIVTEIGASAICGDHSGNRWSEEYQAELVEAAVRKVLSDPRFTGVSLWQFANSNTYLNSINALSRPGGYNNKGLVDQYRRPKAAWRRLSDLLLSPKK